MNEQTEKLIRELADRLGVTVEHLWEVLIRQAGITAIMDVIGIVLMVASLIVAYLYVAAKTKIPPKTEEYPYPRAAWDTNDSQMAWILVTLVGGLSAILILLLTREIVTCLVNPEYWALTKLLGGE